MEGLETDLDAFFTDHRRCGEKGDVDERPDGSAVAWLACEACGVRIVREA